MAPLHHHFELLGWAETTIVVRFWLIAGLFVGLGLGLFYVEWLPGDDRRARAGGRRVARGAGVLVCVAGLGVAGPPAARALAGRGAQVTCWSTARRRASRAVAAELAARRGRGPLGGSRDEPAAPAPTWWSPRRAGGRPPAARRRRRRRASR